MKYLVAILLSLVVFSCKKENAAKMDASIKKEETSAPQPVATKGPLKLDVFPFPQEIEGCSCYFAANRQDFVAQKYIYADDFEKSAFLRINGQIIKFKAEENAQKLTEEGIDVHLKNNDFEISIKGKPVADGEIETTLFQGTITVKDNFGQSISQPFYGECGC